MQDILSVDEACSYLKLAKPTLYKFARSGQIPATKFGSVWRFHRASLDRWIQERVEHDTAARNGTKVRKKVIEKTAVYQ